MRRAGTLTLLAAYQFLPGALRLASGCLLCHGNSEMPPLSSARSHTLRFDYLDALTVKTGSHRDIPDVRSMSQLRLRHPMRMATDDDSRHEENEQVPKVIEEEGDDSNDSMSTAMIASIGFYKKIISPLLPPACRFVPTCSQYGVQAIKEYGPEKGILLIIWRLLRCSPIGGKGYDPPKWPPVSFTYSSY